ncbi:MAG: hypothetical protein OXU62_03535 [Gammaproteobacteria bacterium]|nr:hypothetical protein [Gammaproteobacteria bacterium]
MLPQLALPQIEALHLLVESAFLTDTESRVFNCPGEKSKKDSGFPLNSLRE